VSDGYERQLSDLYRVRAREEPPASIDNAILAAARHEARGSTRVGIRWGVPLALAAVVVLSVSLVTVMRDASELSGESMNVEEQRQASPAPADPDKPRVVADESEQRRGTRLQERTITEQKAAGLAESGKLNLDRAKRPSTPGLTKEEITAEEITAEEITAKEITASVPTPAGPVPPSPTSVPAPSATSPSNAADQLRSELAKPGAQQSSPVPAPARARVNANRALDATSAESRKSKAVAAGRTASGPAVGAAAEKALRSDAHAGDALSPEQWLKRIERLREEGKATEAQASFNEFRKRYPAYPLPETLK
jgi:hypothetical protein